MTDENLEVVSMLPDINAKKRYKASGGLQRVLKIQGHWTWHFFHIKLNLVGTGSNLKLPSCLVISKPTPPRALRISQN